MKAIMKPIKPKTCANIMNLIQSILVIKNKREANAIQKLIDKNGYAEIYMCCTKGKLGLYDNRNHITCASDIFFIDKLGYDIPPLLNGKVVAKFRCYMVEEIEDCLGALLAESLGCLELLQKSCLWYEELYTYLFPRGNDDIRGYAIHISDLEIFDKPKELSEFKHYKKFSEVDYMLPIPRKETCERLVTLTKAPQSWCYVEV